MGRMRSMNHDTHLERVSLYIDHALGVKESAELFAHLAGCDECRSFMKTIMHIHSEIRDEGLSDVSSSLDRRVLGERKDGHSETRRWWYPPVWFTRVSIPVPAAASILFLIIVGSLLAAPLLLSRPTVQSLPRDPLASSIPSSVQNELKQLR